MVSTVARKFCLIYLSNFNFLTYLFVRLLNAFQLFLVGNILVASCEGPTVYGPVVHVDFFKINRPCTCIVTPSFVGYLLVTSRENINVCYTQVNVQNSIIFKCPSLYFTSQTLYVQINQAVDVRAEYTLPSTSGRFYHCVGFQQNGKYAYTSSYKLPHWKSLPDLRN